LHNRAFAENGVLLSLMVLQEHIETGPNTAEKLAVFSLHIPTFHAPYSVIMDFRTAVNTVLLWQVGGEVPHAFSFESLLLASTFLA